MPILHMKSPHTQEGANLVLTEEQEQNCKVLYRKTEDGYVMAGLYDPQMDNADCLDELIAVPLRSCYGGTRNIVRGTQVWNVSGSAGDRWSVATRDSWLQVWTDNAGGTTKCYVAGSVDPNTQLIPSCNTLIYGGHMVDTDATKPDPGVNGVVFIIPICNAHNNYHKIYAFTVCDQVTALVLNKYHLIM